MIDVIREKDLKILEFDQIRQQLAALTISPMAAKMAEDLKPSPDPDTVKRWQRETGEGRLLCSRNAFSPINVEDITLFVQRAVKGSALSGSELARIHLFGKAARRWTSFFKDGDQVERYPLIAALGARIKISPELHAALEKSIDEQGNILDSASPELTAIRTKITNSQNRIRDKLEDYLRSANYRRYLQETLVTIRGGRYVLPVKQEYRQQLDGVVHDQSASGATLFIEPLPVVTMQNDLVVMQRQEELEIEKILYRLSGIVAENQDDLLQSSTIYGELDFIIARGRLSLACGGSEPEIVDHEPLRISLTKAYHPLLPGEKVPLTLELGGEVQALIITGPNTGGKTVALKTIGLLSVMVQSGLGIPAGKGTRMPIFSQVRADIGDEQSIAQSLSTFSGHMKNIIAILNEVGPGSLALFDELGAGTDPSEGSALAMAVLSYLTERGVLTVATTHSNELKLFAQVQEKMQNASMEFDPDTLAPTYRLLQGVPGQSNALYIAEQLGLDLCLLNKAKKFLHRSHDQVESVIASLVEDQQRYHRDSLKAAMERNRAELIFEKMEKERELLKARKDDILQEARAEARRIIRSVKSSTDQLIMELKTLKSGSSAEISTGIEKVRQELNVLRREIDDGETVDYGEEGLTVDDLVTGAPVYVPVIKQKGEIISVSAGEALVQVGSMKVNLSLRDLRRVEGLQVKGKYDPPDKAGGYSVDKDLTINRSVDLRGLNFDEAQPLVDKLLDNALWAGLNSVDLIHGKGTGKLKEALRNYIKNHPQVRRYRSGGPAEGGEGVTVVEINN